MRNPIFFGAKLDSYLLHVQKLIGGKLNIFKCLTSLKGKHNKRPLHGHLRNSLQVRKPLTILIEWGDEKKSVIGRILSFRIINVTY
jgi:hypothetical protein